MNDRETTLLLRIAPRRALADEWALALSADGLSPSVWPEAGGYAIGVPASQASRARDVLAMVEREGRRAPRVAEEPIAHGSILAALVLAAALLGFFFLTATGGPLGGWLGLGSGDTDRILHGEPWRVATALTLHVDFPHALANALFLALFLPPLFRALGGGAGALALLLSGLSGNLLSALFYGTAHRAVGASTAVFGAVGLLCALAARRRVVPGERARAWIPLGAGVALLALLGAGQRSDLMAHLFGLLSGIAIGALILLASRRRPGERAQRLCGAAALTLLVAAWTAARLLSFPVAP